MDEILEQIKVKLKALLAQPADPIRYAASGPTVIMVAGVNGCGKTTSIAKLACMFQGEGKKVVLGAADTFRAAAVEQLTIWAERLGAEIVTGAVGSDPASVAHRAVAQALQSGADVCIVDTAGRLQTQQNLMQELTKIHRVLGKQIPDAPHEVLLVLDATTGQNGISQAKHFTDAVRCTGIMLAKLDGTAKGGRGGRHSQAGRPAGKVHRRGREGRGSRAVRCRQVRRRPVRGHAVTLECGNSLPLFPDLWSAVIHYRFPLPRSGFPFAHGYDFGYDRSSDGYRT